MKGDTDIATAAVSDRGSLRSGSMDPETPERAGGGGEATEAEARDARLGRMDRVAVLYGEITAATREFLAALAESDRHRDWAAEGFGSCAEWLAWRIGVTRNTANEKVRAARALEKLPLTSEAMAKGEISFSKVRALTRAATPDNETELLELAKAGSAAKLERIVRGWKRWSRYDEAEQERLRHRTRRFSVVPDHDGMYVVRGRLTAEVGALLMRAVEAAGDALWAERRQNEGDDRRDDSRARDRGDREDADRGIERPEPRQLRADAVGLLAERALAAGLDLAAAPISGSRAERYQVMLHVDLTSLAEEGEPGRSELGDGTRVTAETARRLACDAARVDVQEDSEGSIVAVGRRTRTVPPALRRALEVRDRGCQFPGCGLRFTEAHHIRHWADGGETSLANTVLLCRRHHRRVHEGRWRVCSDPTGETIVFFRPDGRALAEAPTPPKLEPDPAGTLMRGNRRRGVTPDYRSCGPRWKHDSAIPWSIEAAAREALDPWEDDARRPRSSAPPAP